MTGARAATAAILLGAAGTLAPRAGRAEAPRGFAIVPRGARAPFPVAVWLHGYRGWSPEGYVPGASPAAMQRHADAAGAVIIGIPGTIELPDGGRRWSEDPASDDACVRSRLRGAAKTLDLDLSRVALFGFSEGGLVAAELATIHPDLYRGAVVMSPGGTSVPRVAARGRPEHARQLYLFFCNAGEDPEVVALTRALAADVRDLGARARLRISAGSLHARPPDFMEKLPDWIREVLSPRR